jgi:3,4-dihydroxy 2-butanone 4-phosphate synthase/GTP cyclohydrolase II
MEQLTPIAEAIETIRAGGMIILVDDEDRENEGDLVVAADAVTAEQIAFMAREARGLICLALSPELSDRLALLPMAAENSAPLGTAFTHSIDHVSVAGPAAVSASARAATMRAAVSASASPADFVAPGHVFPLRARRGGVLVRSGQTEGSVDLARLAGRPAAGVICEIMGPDGAMMRMPQLQAFSARFGIPITSVAALIRYRLEHERLVRVVSRARLPTEHGDFELSCYENTVDGRVHVALVHGRPDPEVPTLVRVHRADVVADVFGLGVNRARNQLARSLARMAREPAGVVVYLRPDGDADPVDARVRQYGAIARGERPPSGAQTMGFHDFGLGAQILRDLGLGKIRVLTSSPRLFKGLSGHGLEIVDWVATEPEETQGDAPASP